MPRPPSSSLDRSSPPRRRRLVGALAGTMALALFAALAPATTTSALAAEDSALTLESDVLQVGDQVSVTYQTDQPTENNWVALYAEDVPEPGSGLGLAWTYAPGDSGTVQIDLQDRDGDDLAPGTYRVEYLHDDGWDRLSDPVAFTIAESGSASTLDLSAPSVERGETLSIDYVTDVPDDTNWIGLYPETAGPPGTQPSTLWEYTPDAQGTVDFSTAGLTPGTYRVWFLALDGYDVLAGPEDFTVTGSESGFEPVDPVQTGPATDGVVYRQSFDGLDAGEQAPDGWTNDGWAFTTREGWRSQVDQMRHRFGRAQATIAVADPTVAGVDDLEASLTSEPVDVSDESTLRLVFDSHYRGADDQSASVTVSFDDGDATELLRLDADTVESGYDPLQMNGRQDLIVDVPAGADTARFSWTFSGTAEGHYWGIDSVFVQRVQREPGGEPTTGWVVSDIQGHPQDLAQGLQGFHALAPDADGLLMVGDIVDTGAAWEWDEIYAVMDEAQDILPRQRIAAIGNHERYAAGGFEANRDRFLAFAERDEVWAEYVLEGPGGDLPVLVIGQDAADPPDVPMSEEQFAFLAERLAHWTERDHQILVLTHFPLGNTVSASWIPWYSDHHERNDDLTALLGGYPNAVVLSGHTHYPAELGDWSMQRRTAAGHPDGFWAVNTLAMHVEWDAVGENTAGINEVVTGDINRGLTVDAYADRLVIRAYDFFADGEQLRQVTIPNPLVAFDAVTPDAGGPGEPGGSDGPGDSGGSEQPGGAADTGDGETVTGGGLPGTGTSVSLWALLAALVMLATGVGVLRHRRSLTTGEPPTAH